MKEDLLIKIKEKGIKYYRDFFETVFPMACVRPYLYYLKDYFKGKDNLVGCEIGVYLAHNSYNIMQVLPMKKLYLIDPYGSYNQSGKTYNWNDLEKKAHRRMRHYHDKIEWIKKYSNDCLKDIPDLDFIFIDGNHSYEFVRDDINNYYPKVKQGGVLAGDDFTASYFGVVKAVSDFCNNKKIKLQGFHHDWWFIKEGGK